MKTKTKTILHKALLEINEMLTGIKYEIYILKKPF